MRDAAQALDNLMSLAFKPIEMSLATLDHEFVDLYADGALGLHKEAGDAAGPAWQMFYHQSVVTDWQLGMVYAGMENGEFWGYFNGAHAPIHPSTGSPAVVTTGGSAYGCCLPRTLQMATPCTAERTSHR